MSVKAESLNGSIEFLGNGVTFNVKARNKTQARQQDTHTVQFSKSSRNGEFEAVADAINRALLS